MTMDCFLFLAPLKRYIGVTCLHYGQYVLMDIYALRCMVECIVDTGMD
jgi:hypothetical protein